MDNINERPEWYDGKLINEVAFAAEYLQSHPMKSVGRTFFTVDGRIADEARMEHDIYNIVKPYIATNIMVRVRKLVDAVRMECADSELPLYRDRINVANGTILLPLDSEQKSVFTTDKDYCRNRLPIEYDRNAPTPETWLRFLSELLEPDDILTLQEFMGYCLIPSTKGQKMLLIIGKGGEGKSRIGVVLRKLLGDNMNTGSIAKIETSPFARADLENQLLLLDDDMKLDALPSTNYIKSIVTAELPMDLERKGVQSYQGDLYARFLGLGNGTLQSLYDKSYGFFRRQMILTTKDKPEGRVDDPFLGEKMCDEIEGIFLWCLKGLIRLIRNDFRFTLSERTMENMDTAIKDGNNVVDFMKSEGYFEFRGEYEISSRELYRIYRQWCDDNAITALSARTFAAHLIGNQSEYRIEYSNRINVDGRFVRGFVGIKGRV